MAKANRKGAAPAGLMGYGQTAGRQGANYEFGNELGMPGATAATGQTHRIGQNAQRTTVNLRGKYSR